MGCHGTTAILWLDRLGPGGSGATSGVPGPPVRGTMGAGKRGVGKGAGEQPASPTHARPAPIASLAVDGDPKAPRAKYGTPSTPRRFKVGRRMVDVSCLT